MPVAEPTDSQTIVRCMKLHHCELEPFEPLVYNF